MPTAKGWVPGQTPVAAPGLKVNAFASGLKHPRWIHVLPNGDVTVAEALIMPGPIRSLFDYAMFSTLKRAAAIGPSPNRITLLRDADGDGVAETREVFLEGLSQPFGMALVGDTFYVGNTDGIVAFPYVAGATRITATGRRLTTSSPVATGRAACWPARMARRLYVGVGSLSNIGETAWRSKRAAPPSTSSTWRPASTASSRAACATRWAWRGSRTPARCGRWSTNATASATRRRPTI